MYEMRFCRDVALLDHCSGDRHESIEEASEATLELLVVDGGEEISCFDTMHETRPYRVSS